MTHIRSVHKHGHTSGMLCLPHDEPPTTCSTASSSYRWCVYTLTYSNIGSQAVTRQPTTVCGPGFAMRPVEHIQACRIVFECCFHLTRTLTCKRSIEQSVDNCSGSSCSNRLSSHEKLTTQMRTVPLQSHRVSFAICRVCEHTHTHTHRRMCVHYRKYY